MHKHFITAACGVLTALMFVCVAMAAPCDNTAGDPLVRHDLTASPATSTSYCELCGTGYITIVISNPFDRNTDMIDMTVAEDLGSSGLTYAGSIQAWVNGTPVAGPSGPVISGANNQILTWTSTEIPDLGRLASNNNNSTSTTITIRFSVERAAPFTEEGLIAANRDISVSLDYTAEDVSGIPSICPGTPATATDSDTLPLREPNPTVVKLGRNVDAGQDAGEYTQQVYGNIDDDIIWRIEVGNNGTADLQDLELNDVLDVGSLGINDLLYICDSEAAANNAAVTGSAGACAAFPGGNSLTAYDVDLPFASPTAVDVPAGGATYLYLVGKIPSSPNGSCSSDRTNTVSNIHWGCDAEPPAGDIAATSFGASPGSATATLNTLSDRDLDIAVDYDGVGAGNPDAGTKGRVVITITNNSGGTVSDLVVTNTLPSEYVVDATFTPSLAAAGAYGGYSGLTNQVTWDNPNVNPLLNTAPQFTLTSSASTNDGHANLLRNGDQLVLTFGIVLVRSASYDREADLDITEEDPAAGSTDPDHSVLANLPNSVSVTFNDFCTGGPNTDTFDSTHTARPEDLDVQTHGPSGPVLDYILTNSTSTTLTVRLTNNGGHSAADYYAYVAFGQTMEVDTGSLPAGCTATPTDMPPLTEWQTPLGFPAGATIIECKESAGAGTIARNGGYVDLDFIVNKTTDPARIAADDLTFRADVIGEITLDDGTRLTFPAIVARGDGIADRANNYTMDAIRARVMGFNLNKNQSGNCSENNPPPGSPDDQVQIGEECGYNIQAGGWFGFLTPGYTPIQVRNVRVDDILPNGQGYVDRSAYTVTPQITDIDFQRSVAPTPPGQYDLAEGTLYWTFNDAGSYITTRDEWFELDVTTRLLNDPVDASAAPNQHAAGSTNSLTSTFDVVFLVGDPSEFTVPYGPSMSVYPPLSGRQVSLTVTEPSLTVVKEVCNETLYGAGPACTNWVTAADDGDALNTYIYRLTVSNEASDSGVIRAPAYDVTVTDTLDASDLAYVLPLGSDGLNNDGDAATDGADAGGEGAISDNTVSNGTPAVITFSYTQSDALLRIDPGDSVQLYYRVDFDDDAAPLQTFTNTAYATYDSLEGAYGSQSDPPPALRTYGDSGDARDYTSPTAGADVQIIPIETRPKRIAALSSTPVAGSGTQQVSVGEEIEYRLNTLLPVALLRNFVIRDELPAGITCAEAPVVDLGPTGPYAAAGFTPGGSITPTCTGTEVQWNFGDQRVTAGTAGLGNRFNFGVGFIARVANTTGNNDGDTITNGNPTTNAFARYVDEVGATITQNFGEVDVQVREPLIAVTKTFAVANADAADVLTVTVTATNNGTATAYNLQVLDDLAGTDLTYIGNPGGANPPDTVDTTTLGANRPIFSWSAPNGIDPANTVSFTFEVRVDDGVQPQEILDNTLQADWTSLQSQTTALNSGGAIGANGAADGMRNGALPNAGDALNDYETSAADDVLVPAVVMTKTDLNPAAVPAVGEHKSFQIEITLPEGVTDNLTVTDTLDGTGLSYVLENDGTYDITYTFQGIATINGAAPGEAAMTAFPADETSGSAVWNIGTVTTQTENDTAVNAVNPLIRITYLARINNDAVTDAGDTLQNAVAATYTHGETGATVALNDTTAVQNVVEPSLGLAKSVANVTTPGNPPQAGDILRYTVTLTAAGGGPGDNFSDAFDVRIEDSLSLGLVYSGNPTVDGAGNTISGPATTGDGVTTPQTLTWSLEDGNADIDVTEGTVVTVTYDVLVDNSVLIGQNLGNSVMARWTSLDGTSTLERNGTATPAYNDYFTGPVTATVVVGDNTATTKTRLFDTYGPGDNVLRIGDIVEYELRLALQEGTYNSVTVTDTVPQGLIFEGIADINGDTSAPYAAVAPFAHADIPGAAIVVAGNAATGPTTVTMTLGDIVNQADGNPANDDFVIVYRARVLNLVHPQVNNIALTNTAAMGYDTISGPATTITDTETIDVRQPSLSVAKSAAAAGGDSVLDAGELVTYTIDITNNGTAPAYDTVLRDIIPVGMRNGTATITMVSVQLLSGPVLASLAPVYDAATGTATWDFDTGTADAYTIPAGDTLRLVYQTQTEAGLAPGMTLTNQAQVQLYHSFDDDGVPARGGVLGVREIYGPSNTGSITFTTAGAAALDKANSVATAAIGQPFTYRITVPATAQTTALHDVRILDDLSASAASLTFIGVTKVSGTGSWTPVNTGTATSLVIEDTTNGIEIPAGEQIEIDITVRLADTQPAVDPPPAPNDTGATFANTASYTFNQVDGDAGTRQAGGADTTANMTIVGPDMLVMDKSGPANMAVGAPAGFVLDIHNTASGAAWNLTVVDRLPDDAANGGTCGAGPSNVTAQFFDDGGTPTSGLLTAGTDYTVNFDSASCEWTLQLLSVAGALQPDDHLVINYDTELDPDTLNAAALTNVAGVTQWYGYDPGAPNAAPHRYTYALTDGTPGDNTDQEDAHTINTQAPDLDFFKRVRNVTTGQDPGLNASPGDTLHYTLEVINNGSGGLTGISITDELDALNSQARFVPGSLVLTVPPGADTSGTNPTGGAKGTGLVDVGNLSLAGWDGVTLPRPTVVVEFDITLAPAIPSGTVVLNQAGLTSIVPTTILSDDPNVGGGSDPTQTLISSAPQFQVRKISTDLTGDPAVLMAGDTLRYTITIKNIGDENAVNVRLQDFTPANTTYVANSTTLNGSAVPDAGPGVNPLNAGIPVNAPENTTAGYMRADAAPAANNTATVTFDVVVDPAAMDGLIIENQGFVGFDGEGSGAQPVQPSDDPDTPTPDDPTRDVVGNMPLLYAQKTVTISVDNGTAGIVDPGDTLRYTIDIRNSGAIPATGVVLTDAMPANTTYAPGSTRLNGTLVADVGGFSPLVGGLTVRSSDNPGAGIVSAGQSATVTFDVVVDGGLATGTIISNQGDLTSNELPPGLTDADGLPSNGYQPTIVVVGAYQLVTITKSVGVVGGGPALAGGQLQYTVRVTNVSSIPANNVVITDDLDQAPPPGQLPLNTLVTYVAGSGAMDGAAAGVTFAGNLITADYGATYGDLPAGASAELRFRVQINAGVATGTTITNAGEVSWNGPDSPASASVSIDVGGTPGSAALNGNVWHDADLDTLYDSGERQLQGWSVALYRNGSLAANVTTDAGGAYRIGGLLPNAATPDTYEIRFTALGGGPTSATLGNADSIFTNGPHRISDIVAASGDNLQNLNLPIQPNGTVYNAVQRIPVRGATLTLHHGSTNNSPVPAACFNDPNQQDQVTATDGFYKFDLNFSDNTYCPFGDPYFIEVKAPGSGYLAAPSAIIPPASDAATAPYSVPACPADAVPATPGLCEAVSNPAIPPVTVLPRTAGTTYYLHLLLSNGSLPGESQIFNNPIPIDPELSGATAITKTAAKRNVTRGALVPYTITVTNIFGVPLYDLNIIDRFPAGFKYVADSARLNGTATEPLINGRELTWTGLSLQANERIVIKLLLVVGSGVSEGEYVNRAFVYDTVAGANASGEASATVRVIPDPDFDCTDVIGKVFDDANLNGTQDDGEPGLKGVRVATVRGLVAATDAHGRFHITCAAVPDEDRGSNFILKLDERSLPSGYRLTTENPRVQRATRGKMLRYRFGATIHRVVRMDIADGVFEPDTTELRPQWTGRIDQLLAELKKSSSVLRLTYLGDLESKELVSRRLDALKKMIANQWKEGDGGYPLTIETQVFWRRGKPIGK